MASMFMLSILGLHELRLRELWLGSVQTWVSSDLGKFWLGELSGYRQSRVPQSRCASELLSKGVKLDSEGIALIAKVKKDTYGYQEVDG